MSWVLADLPTQSIFLDFSTFWNSFKKVVVSPKGGYIAKKTWTFIRQHNLLQLAAKHSFKIALVHLFVVIYKWIPFP